LVSPERDAPTRRSAIGESQVLTRFGRSLSLLNLMLRSGTSSSGVTPGFQTGGPRSLQLFLRLHF